MTAQPADRPATNGPATSSGNGTYGESLRRAVLSGASPCHHGEPRGSRYCALCRGVRGSYADLDEHRRLTRR